MVVDPPSHYFKIINARNEKPFKYSVICLKFIIKMEENFAFIHSYKTDQPIENIEDFPIDANQRIQTDRFCTIMSSLFAIGMLIGAIAGLDLGKLQRMTYPTDNQGRHCTLDNANYNYVYFTSTTDPSKRLCVQQCPKGTEERLNCWPTQNLSCSKNSNFEFEVTIYPSKPSSTSLGLFCEATDPALNKKILDNAGMSGMYEFVAAYKSIGVAFLISIGLGIVGVLAFTAIPGIMAYTTIILGGIGSIVFAIYLMTSLSELSSAYKGLVVIFSILLAFVGLLLIYASIWRQKDIKISIVYLQQASKCFWEFPTLAGLSFLFLICLIGLVALIGFQVLAYWSHSQLKFDPKSVYLYPTSNFAVFMTVLNFIEFVWGLSFLKQAFNLLVSGTSVCWFFDKKHSLSFGLSNLFRFHWGSVVAAAFLMHLLYPLDLLYDIFKPPANSRGLYRSLCCCCEKVLDLVRSQAMVMVNIAGLPYCNASRWCQKVEYHSQSTQGNQSANRFVRMGAHLMPTLIATLVAYLYMKNQSISVLALILSFIINIFVLTFFVCLLKDIVESLYFSFMFEEYYQNAGSDSVAKKLFPQGYQVLPTQ